MKWFRNASVKTKITLAISMACIPVLLSFAAFAWNDARMIKENLIHQTSALADTLGANSIAALLFQDPDVAGEVLTSVRHESSIQFACTYDEAGRVFARYGEPNQIPLPVKLPIAHEGIVLDGEDYIDIIKPIWHNEQQAGALLLRVRTSQLDQQFRQYIYIFVAVLLFAITLTSVAASMIHRAISRPIVRMANAMRRVSTTNDYTCRVEKEADDELGVLSDGFNNMLTQIERLMGQLQELAFHDTLTGLPNRASILRSIQDAIDRGKGNHLALLFLDFDRFKLINDSLGHDVGDELLIEIANRLNKSLRATDKIQSARLGGDEFVVLLDDLSSRADATVVADRLLHVLSGSYKLGSHTVYSTASIGVVTSEHGYESASGMLRDADLAMYEAKAAGRGCYAIFDRTIREREQARLRIEGELREAISGHEFVLAYQPIVSLESGEVEGFEALVRWLHPQRGLIGPDEFVPVAEETGMIVSIGNWVLDEACRQFAHWRRSLGADAPRRIHVNVSRKQLLLPNLVRIVEQTLERHAILPECLHLEVTESMIMHDLKLTVATLDELRELGVKIDMDDFGTGYSSLSCLHEFPIDVLKIDRAFIANVKRVRDFAALLHATVTLADNLGLQVVAEGIEDVEQLTLLQSLGCEYGQGYFFAKPMFADEVEIFVGSKVKPTPSEFEASSMGVPVRIPADETDQIQQCEVER